MPYLKPNDTSSRSVFERLEELKEESCFLEIYLNNESLKEKKIQILDNNCKIYTNDGKYEGMDALVIPDDKIDTENIGRNLDIHTTNQFSDYYIGMLEVHSWNKTFQYVLKK